MNQDRFEFRVEVPKSTWKFDTGKPPLKLVGTDGNAFAILGLAVRAARKAGWSHEQISDFQSEAMTGDYDHLLQTVMKHFDVE